MPCSDDSRVESTQVASVNQVSSGSAHPCVARLHRRPTSSFSECFYMRLSVRISELIIMHFPPKPCEGSMSQLFLFVVPTLPTCCPSSSYSLIRWPGLGLDMSCFHPCPYRSRCLLFAHHLLMQRSAPVRVSVKMGASEQGWRCEPVPGRRLDIRYVVPVCCLSSVRW